MRKSFGVKTFMYPMPVLVIATYDENGVANAMTAAWGSIADFTKIALFLAGEHKTVKNILAKKAFTVSMANVANVAQADYVGIVSGNDVANKIANTGWHCTKSSLVDAPLIEELPLTIECKLDKWDAEREMLIGEIVNVSADEAILDAQGNIDVNKLQPLVFDTVKAAYLQVGAKVADAFNVGAQLKK